MNLLILDLDGTVTKSDNLVRFTYFMLRKEKKLKFLLFFPLLILLKFHLISNIKFKIYYSLLIIRNLGVDYLRDCARKFVYTESFQQDLNPEIIKYINEQENTTKIILSANYDFIAECIAELLKIKTCISVNLATSEGNYTGLISGQIPYGKNKINALTDFLLNKNYTKTIGLGDSESDLPLLQYLDEGYQIKHDTKTNKTTFFKV